MIREAKIKKAGQVMEERENYKMNFKVNFEMTSAIINPAINAVAAFPPFRFVETANALYINTMVHTISGTVRSISTITTGLEVKAIR